jgi:ADP-ribosylglycohydrolase
MDRAALSLEGLSVGDGFGERFFDGHAFGWIAARTEPPSPWGTTDDTEMATAIVDVLERRKHIDRDLLARAFARRFAVDPMRGYGAGARQILQAIHEGTPWAKAAGDAFGGQGSLGNGGAMRAAPVGAYFLDSIDDLVENAAASAQVTHAHPDGQAGAIAVALAAAYAHFARHDPAQVAGQTLIDYVLKRTPEGATRKGLVRAQSLDVDLTVEIAARHLGTGHEISSADTVPFSLWCAQRELQNFPDAMWTTVMGLGDRDTTCAIVGGIVALYTGIEGIPLSWRVAREAIRHDVELPAH